MLDGLGLVSEKQGNTGAAAYGQGVPINPNPLAPLQNSLNNEYQIRLQDKLAKERQEAAKKQKDYDLNFELGNVWDTDIQYLGELQQGAKIGLAELKGQGVNPNNYLDERAKKYGEIFGGLNGAKTASIQQKKLWEGSVAELQNDLGSKDPKYDFDASAKNLTEYKKLRPNERINYDVSKLLVRKPAPFESYAAIKDLNVDDFINKYKNEYEDPNMASSKSSDVFDEKRASNVARNFYTNTDIGKQNLQDGINKGTWSDIDSAVETQVAQLKNYAAINKSAGYKKKAPKENAGTGLTEDQVNAIVNTPSTVMKIADLDIDGSPRTRDGVGEDGKPVKNTIYTNASILYPQSVGNLNLPIPSAAAFNVNTGKKGNGATIYKMTDGTLGVALKYADGRGFIGDINPEENESVYVFKDKKTGKTVRLSKDDAIKQGYIEYVPVIIGNGAYKDPNDSDGKEISQPLIVEAEQYINTVNGKESQPLNDAYSKLTVQKQLAAKLNGTSAASTKGNQNKPAGAVKKDSYKIKGKDYSATAIEKAAKASNMTVEQYLEEANK